MVLALAEDEGGDTPGDERRLTIPAGERREFFFRLPPEAVLTFDALALPAAEDARLLVKVRPARGREKLLAELDQDRGFETVALPGDEHRIVRLSFTVEGGAKDGPAARAVLTRPVVRSLGLPTGGSGERPGTSPDSERPGRRPNVILYAVDTLRSWNLGAYGYPRPVSPHLDRFAAGATLFENAFAQTAWTRTAMASIFTGLDPRRHGANDREDALSEEASTLAEILRDAGYRTVAFVTNGNVGPQFGFGQGFDRFELLQEIPTEQLQLPADQVNELLFRWLREEGSEQPFFLYVHTTDPHAPYAPPEPFRQRFEDHTDSVNPLSAAARSELAKVRQSLDSRFGPAVLALEPGSMVWMRGLAQGLVPVTEGSIRHLRSLYDAEIAFNDAAFGAFLDELRRLELYQGSVVVFTADHGEEFQEHGGWQHGATLYQEQLLIPLVLKLPGQERGERRSDPAQQVDLLPTLLEAAGIEDPGTGDGRSLLTAAGRKDGRRPRAIRSYLKLDAHRMASVVDGRYKLIVRWQPQASVELYDLESDPTETFNLAGELPAVEGYLHAQLAAGGEETGSLAVKVEELEPELRRRLEALGYLN